MTIDEFNKIDLFSEIRKCLYKKREYQVIDYSYIENIAGLSFVGDSDCEIMWVRCENIEIIK